MCETHMHMRFQRMDDFKWIAFYALSQSLCHFDSSMWYIWQMTDRKRHKNIFFVNKLNLWSSYFAKLSKKYLIILLLYYFIYIYFYFRSKVTWMPMHTTTWSLTIVRKTKVKRLVKQICLLSCKVCSWSRFELKEIYVKWELSTFEIHS